MKSIQELFPRASKSFIQANPHVSAIITLKPDKNAVQVNLERNNEATDSRQIPNPKPKRPVRNESLGEKARKDQGSKRCIIGITSFRCRLTDPDNLCPKYLIDSLRYAGAIYDDREKDIELHISQEKVKTYKEEKTLIVIDL